MSSIKLEAGKYYRSRDGRKFGPVRNRAEATGYDDIEFIYPWDIDDDSEESWTGVGRYRYDKEDSLDLVAEWTDEPKKPACSYGSDSCTICDGTGMEDDEPLVTDDPAFMAEFTGQVGAAYAQGDTRPERVRILNDGAALTNGDRDDEYGPPANNMACAGELKATFRRWLARDISPGELEALDMAMTKLSRLACGKPKRDTYVDAATYIAIAGEVALKA